MTTCANCGHDSAFHTKEFCGIICEDSYGELAECECEGFKE